MNRIKRNNKGFTLLELMVTITIMGVLSAIAVPPVMDTVKKARLSADIRTLQTIQRQVDFYMAEHEGDFPGIASFPTAEIELGNGVWTALKTENYLSERDLESSGQLALQTKLSGEQEILVKYSPNKDHIYMELPASIATGASTDKKLIPVVKALDGTIDEGWCVTTATLP